MNHPIEALMRTAMESLKEMVDVNTVVGDAVQAPDGSLIIPVSRVACGFAVGGSEFSESKGQSQSASDTGLPFGGGSGAGVSVQPVAFLVVHDGNVRLLPVDGNAVAERLIDLAPQVMDKIRDLVADRGEMSEETGECDEEKVEEKLHERKRH
ncbi:GerW family sporulation protein [Heliobacterium chlorum]|uniref:GerW family sporulation protein n=1 Tax=Heliobacterium chlorum TaxID=2698 RepID=A0ABR7SZI3_HELCL|nr:GerW family sporulation protein [Heliobacterium chlorum]MBC9783100.1 GerW family sporulation protein [Heliobacterium chlorum]